MHLAPAGDREGPFPGLVQALLHRPTAAIGAALTALVFLVALFAGRIAPGFAFAVSVPHRFEPPSGRHLMGTDQLGRDVFTAVIQGAHTSITIVAGVTILATGIGLTAGVVAGFRSGLVDDAMMRLVDVVQSVPRFFLALLAAGSFGNGVRPLTVVLGLTSWPLLARVVRAETLSLRERDFVIATRALGASNTRIVLRHVIPNVMPSAVVVAALTASRVVLLEAGLAFLGLSNPNVPSWGALLNNAEPFLARAWWMSVFPGGAVVVAVLGMNLLSDGLREVLDPVSPDGGRDGVGVHDG